MLGTADIELCENAELKKRYTYAVEVLAGKNKRGRVAEGEQPRGSS